MSTQGFQRATNYAGMMALSVLSKVERHASEFNYKLCESRVGSTFLATSAHISLFEVGERSRMIALILFQL